MAFYDASSKMMMDDGLFILILILLLIFVGLIKQHCRKRQFLKNHNQYGIETFHLEVLERTEAKDSLLVKKTISHVLSVISDFSGIDIDCLSPEITMNQLFQAKLIDEYGDHEAIALAISELTGCDLDLFEKMDGDICLKELVIAIVQSTEGS